MYSCKDWVMMISVLRVLQSVKRATSLSALN
jgi:hypothetical protein